jgi:hypothetical protein
MEQGGCRRKGVARPWAERGFAGTVMKQLRTVALRAVEEAAAAEAVAVPVPAAIEVPFTAPVPENFARAFLPWHSAASSAQRMKTLLEVTSILGKRPFARRIELKRNVMDCDPARLRKECIEKSENGRAQR